MNRQYMLKQLKIESDYLFYQNIHELIDRNGAMKSRIFNKKESVLSLFFSLYQQLAMNIEFLELDDRTFLDNARTALEKWLKVSNEVFMKESVIDLSDSGTLSIHSYNLLIDLVSNL